MSRIFHTPKARTAGQARTKESRTVATVYAILLLVMALAQLFTISSFLQNLYGYGWGYTASAWYAGILIVAELLAIPFLLRWRLSIGFRVFSMGLSWLVPLALVLLSVLALTRSDANSVAFLGGFVQLLPGWWAVCLSVALGIMAWWASWGLWPLRATANKSSKKHC